jgi:hypothetical protein
MRVQNNAFFGNIKMFDRIMRPCIKLLIYVSGKVFTQVHIITVTAQAFPVVGYNFNGSVSNFF